MLTEILNMATSELLPVLILVALLLVAAGMISDRRK